MNQQVNYVAQTGDPSQGPMNCAKEPDIIAVGMCLLLVRDQDSEHVPREAAAECCFDTLTLDAKAQPPLGSEVAPALPDQPGLKQHGPRR